ncbi:hypothetical protein [Streptomyces sp. NPDC000410]|uniref:hypothetical protein n=1 Tax=Streptomyces sp. NPDC000410 TaxID=3154254 RepID=UPI00331E8CCA
MDEMTNLRAMRDDAPIPSRARLAPGRRRLLDAATAAREPSRLGRLNWKVIAPAGAAALTVAAILATQAVPGGQPTQEPRLSDAAAFLETAAVEVERTAKSAPAPRLAPGQWAYVSLVDYTPTKRLPPGAKPLLSKDCAGTVDGIDTKKFRQGGHQETWRKGDGTKSAGMLHFGGKCGKMTFHTLGPGGKSLSYYYDFAARPHKPEKLLDDMTKAGIGNPDRGSDTAEDFRTISTLLMMPLKASPEFTATVYRALALIPGVTVSEEERSVLGRPVSVIAYTGGEYGAEGKYKVRQDLLLDPKTYRLLGTREVSTADHVFKDGSRLKEGEVLGYTFKQDVEIVDKPGQKNPGLVRQAGRPIPADHAPAEAPGPTAP